MKVYEIEIELTGLKPLIWRKFIIPETATFDMLHLTIQGAMGWLNCHLYEFELGEVVYDNTNCASSTIAEVLIQGVPFYYRYDFGDNWYHKLLVTKTRKVQKPYDLFHKCIDGERACPPEDAGGVLGYEHLVSILKDKTNSEYKSMRQWAGGFDPDTFSVTQASALICSLLSPHLINRPLKS